VLHRVFPDSTAWVRFVNPIPLSASSIARIALAESTSVYALDLDREGDGFAERI
jgi:hypothetical protein